MSEENRVVDGEALRCVLVSYDIPTRSNIPNPSGRLTRLGFRHQLSSWIMPEGAVPYNLIAELQKEGAKVDIVRFDASEGPRLVRMALDAIRRDIASQVKRCEANLKKAQTNHLELDAELEGNVSAREDALKNYELRSGAICQRLEELMEDSEAAIQQFGLAPERLQIGDARAAFEAFQVGIAARAAAYAGATQALRKLAQETRDSTLNALANAAEADAVPAEVMAGALEDAGDDAAAAALHSAFTAEPETFEIGTE